MKCFHEHIYYIPLKIHVSKYFFIQFELTLPCFLAQFLGTTLTIDISHFSRSGKYNKGKCTVPIIALYSLTSSLPQNWSPPTPQLSSTKVSTTLLHVILRAARFWKTFTLCCTQYFLFALTLFFPCYCCCLPWLYQTLNASTKLVEEIYTPRNNSLHTR